jgi:hypothetical protein
MGRLIFSNNISDNTQQIDLSNHPGGMFFYNITENGTTVKSGKLIKE